MFGAEAKTFKQPLLVLISTWGWEKPVGNNFQSISIQAERPIHNRGD